MYNLDKLLAALNTLIDQRLVVVDTDAICQRLTILLSMTVPVSLKMSKGVMMGLDFHFVTRLLGVLCFAASIGLVVKAWRVRAVERWMFWLIAMSTAAMILQWTSGSMLLMIFALEVIFCYRFIVTLIEARAKLRLAQMEQRLTRMERKGHADH